MKNNFWLLVLMTGVLCVVLGCTSALVTGVPEGSVLTGVYEGTFNGTMNEGTVEVKLYRSPDGSRLFFGTLAEEGSFLHFKGGINENDLQGQILLPSEGTIDGQLSPDGESLSGTYKFSLPPFNHGTWQAQRQ
jgi:hypothetical protein